MNKIIQFLSNQKNVSQDSLLNYFEDKIENVKSLELYDLSLFPAGHGHYYIQAVFKIDRKEFTSLTIKTKTNNMLLVDAWESGMNEDFDNGDYGFKSWEDVCKAMLSAISPEDEIMEIVNDLTNF